MTRKWLSLALAVVLATAGCTGSDDEEALGADSEDAGEDRGEATDGDEAAPSGEEEGAASADAGPPAINRTHEDAGLVGAPVYDPEQALGVKAELARQSYENGANGTYVIGYEVQPREGHRTLTVAASADAVAADVPDYDLFVYGPGGEVVASSYNAGADEEAEVDDVEADAYLVLLYYYAGAADAVTTHIEVT